MPRALTTAEAQRIIRDCGAEPLFDQFLGTPAKHRVRGACGHETEIIFSTIGRSRKRTPGFVLRCDVCRNKGNLRYSVDEVQALFREHGAEPLFEAYEHCETPLPYRCRCGCGEVREVSLSTLHDYLRMNPNHVLRCRSSALREHFDGRHIEEMTARVHAHFREHGAEPLFDSYPGQNTDPLPFLCSCPERRRGVTTWISVNQQGGSGVLRCGVCHLASRPRGETHPNWRHDWNDEERERANAGRGYPMAVYGDFVRRLYDFRCAVSRERHEVVQVHHMRSWSQHPTERFLATNGVPLRGDIHADFHGGTDKGRGTATRGQFLDFFHVRTGHDFRHVLRKTAVEIIFAFEPQPDQLARKREHAEAGVTYIPVFESEVRARRDLVLAMVRHREGIGIQIKGARSLAVQDVTAAQARAFFGANHIQGFLGSAHYLGLTDGETLFSAMTFLSARFKAAGDPEGTYELGRFANRLGWRVPGGASKLLHAFLARHRPPRIVSYADRRFSAFDPADTMYPRLGFVHSHTSAPSYSYTRDGIVVESRMAFQKSRLARKLRDYDPTFTERENMEKAGYARLPDCGTFVYHLTP